jgi:hypothetical protein
MEPTITTLTGATTAKLA